VLQVAGELLAMDRVVEAGEMIDRAAGVFGELAQSGEIGVGA
jgi:hypothetical protein